VRNGEPSNEILWGSARVTASCDTVILLTDESSMCGRYGTLEAQEGVDPGKPRFEAFDGDHDGRITFQDFARAFGVEAEDKHQRHDCIR
jgi:hypothetical protein